MNLYHRVEPKFASVKGFLLLSLLRPMLSGLRAQLQLFFGYQASHSFSFSLQKPGGENTKLESQESDAHILTFIGEQMRIFFMLLSDFL